MSYILTGQSEEALEKLATAIELRKNEPKFYNYKALALYMIGQYEQSLFAFEEALKLYESKNSKEPEVGECWFNLGNALLNLNREEEALDCFVKTLDFDIEKKVQIKVQYAEGRAL